MPPEKDKESSLSPEISRLSAILARDPSSKLFMPLAEEYMRAMMVEEAIMTLEDGLKANPFYMSARVLLGKAYVEKNNLDEALVQFEQVVKAIPDNLLAHRMLGSIYKSLGRYPEATRSYRMISILSPKDEDVRSILEELESGKVSPVKPAPEEKAEFKQEPHSAEPQVEAVQAPQNINAPVFDMSEAEPPSAPELEIHERQEFMDEPLEVLEPEVAPDDAQGDTFLEMPLLDMDATSTAKFETEPEPAESIVKEYLPQEPQPSYDLGWEGELSSEPFYEEPAASAGSGYAVDFKAAGGLEDIFSSYGEPEQDGTPSGNKAGVYEISGEISSFNMEVFKPVQPAKPFVADEAGTEEAAAEPFETGALAELYIAQGFYDRAIGIYKNLLVEDPGNNQIRQKLEDLYQLAGLSSSKATVNAEKESAATLAPAPFVGFDEEPADIWETPKAEIAEIEEQPEQAAEILPYTPGMPGRTNTGAIMRLEQFLTNIRKKAGR